MLPQLLGSSAGAARAVLQGRNYLSQTLCFCPPEAIPKGKHHHMPGAKFQAQKCSGLNSTPGFWEIGVLLKTAIV